MGRNGDFESDSYFTIGFDCVSGYIVRIFVSNKESLSFWVRKFQTFVKINLITFSFQMYDDGNYSYDVHF